MKLLVQQEFAEKLVPLLEGATASLPKKLSQGLVVETVDADAIAPHCMVHESAIVFLDAALIHKCQDLDSDQVLVPVVRGTKRLPDTAVKPYSTAPLSEDAESYSVRHALRRALELLRLRLEAEATAKIVETKNKHISTLHEVGARLTREPRLETLLELIVTKAREIVQADAGSLYLVERADEGDMLSFLVAQNDSLSVPFKAFKMPISETSIAGYVAATGESVRLDDVYELPKGVPFQFNKSFDQSIGYRTKSMLVIPMLDHDGEVLGVLQLINRKVLPSMILTSPKQAEHDVVSFTAEDEELAVALGSQAAIAIENARLYGDIRHLLESFMQASVKAIEARDPTTSGHSERVADYSVGLAKVIDSVSSGRFRNVSFGREDLDQLYFAGILHDFGKIGVREDVLIKAKKLYPAQLQGVMDRFSYLRVVLQLKGEAKKLELLKKKNAYDADIVQAVDAEVASEIARLDEAYKVVLDSNEPSILHQESAEALKDIASASVVDMYGTEIPLLLEDEYKNLSIGKGSLNSTERQEIESHVTHTFNFLKMIPWTKDLQDVPSMAHGHHEKLDGSGYPNQLTSKQIPTPVRIMTVSDIFDALTARDRPYKRAMGAERALSILEMEVKEGKLDKDIVKVFIESKSYEAVMNRAD